MNLNLGCGAQQRDGWIGVDRIEPCDVHVDLRGTLPWPDDSAQRIVAHHVLDYLEWPELLALLREVRRVLAPDGTFRASCTDPWLGLAAWNDHNEDWFDPLSFDGTLDAKAVEYLTLGGHRRILLPQRWAMVVMRAAGLRTRRTAWHVAAFGAWGGDEELVQLDDRPDESWFVDARCA